MFTAKEMREFLAKEYGITTDEELDRELKKKGGIRIGIFTDPAPEKNGECICKVPVDRHAEKGTKICRETA